MWKKSRERAKNRGKGRKKDADANMPLTAQEITARIDQLEKDMRQAARDLEFEQAAGITRPHQGLAGEADSNSRLNPDMKTENNTHENIPNTGT